MFKINGIYCPTRRSTFSMCLCQVLDPPTNTLGKESVLLKLSGFLKQLGGRQSYHELGIVVSLHVCLVWNLVFVLYSWLSSWKCLPEKQYWVLGLLTHVPGWNLAVPTSLLLCAVADLGLGINGKETDSTLSTSGGYSYYFDSLSFQIFISKEIWVKNSLSKQKDWNPPDVCEAAVRENHVILVGRVKHFWWHLNKLGKSTPI